MRTLFLALLISLTLVACGTKDDSLEQPVADAAPAAQEASAPDKATDGQPTSTNAITDEAPEGPVGTMQLADGSTVEIAELIKLGKYYLYISGKLNGRSSTVISLTRFQDLQRWDALIFKGNKEFTIATKQGKELAFTDARLYLGSGSSTAYTFYTFNGQGEKVQTEVKKSDVATIKFR